MTRKKMVAQAVVLCLAVLAGTAFADSVLFDWATNVDGVLTEASLGGAWSGTGADLSLFDQTTGFGTLSWTVGGAGDHSFTAFFDYEIDEGVNTFFNEYGEARNIADLQAGQSWEIDEPGYVFGDIYGNVLAGTLDGLNGVPSTSPDDVSFALDWDFSLAAGQTAIIQLILSEQAPLGGFYLAQIDPDSGANVYLSGAMRIEGGGPAPVPEPATLVLLGAGLLGVLGMKRRHPPK